MRILAQIVSFFIFIILIQSASANDIFDIMDETIFTGDWGNNSIKYNLPPDNGCSMPGTIYVVLQVSRSNRNGDPGYRAYTREYRNCIYKERDEFGNTLCTEDGCWVDMIKGSNMFVLDSIYNRQTNTTKAAILDKCAGVVPLSWQPFYGHPNNPYDVNVQNSGIIWGYVSINFKNLAKINGEYVVANKDSIILNSGSWHEVGSPKTDKDHWVTQFVSINDSTTYKIIDNMVTGTINITVRYRHRRICGDGSYVYCNRTAIASFSTTVPMPVILEDIPSTKATIVSHNNSVTPYSLIDVHIDKNITSTKIEYKNKSSIYHNKIGFMKSSDDLKYFNFVNEPLWSQDSSNVVTYRNGYYVINDAPLDMGDLIITVSTPYNSFEITDYNVTIINSKPSDYVQWNVMIVFLSLLFLFVITSYIIIRRLR